MAGSECYLLYSTIAQFHKVRPGCGPRANDRFQLGSDEVQRCADVRGVASRGSAATGASGACQTNEKGRFPCDERAARTSAPRDPGRAWVIAALNRVRAAVALRGLLLLQDAELPGATTVIVGQVIRGSWWGHPQNKLIYDTLHQLDSEVLWVKLVRSKETCWHGHCGRRC
jgi:hypothetical protein